MRWRSQWAQNVPNGQFCVNRQRMDLFFFFCCWKPNYSLKSLVIILPSYCYLCWSLFHLFHGRRHLSHTGGLCHSNLVLSDVFSQWAPSLPVKSGVLRRSVNQPSPSSLPGSCRSQSLNEPKEGAINTDFIRPSVQQRNKYGFGIIHSISPIRDLVNSL